jgi:pyruvate dehydrogenase E2 component (dihydrolipoamide acetyltransferase)
VALSSFRNWADLVKRARSKQLKPDEYNSGNFSISNLGMYGVESFDAILPPGEGGRSEQSPLP